MRISSLLKTGVPTVSFEFYPPNTDTGVAALLRAIDRLTPIGPDFVSLTYGAGGSTRLLGLELCGDIGRRVKGQVMAHLTGLCHTPEEIASISDQLWDSGIENIMALRGDLPKSAVPGGFPQDFPYAQQVMAFLKTRHDFCLGGACYPEGHKETPDIATGIEHLREKIDNGCEFLVTQMFFDNDNYFRFVDRVRQARIDVPVVPGIMPITGYSQLDGFENKFAVRLPQKLREAVLAHEGDEAAIEAVGIEWTAQQCRELLQGGAPGVHFFTLNRSAATVKVCLAMGLTGSSM